MFKINFISPIPKSNLKKLRTNSTKKCELPNIEKPPRPLGTPPKEGKSDDFPSFGGVPERRGGLFNLITSH
ncbi:hypothetical protein GCM10008015_19260 [Flavobacterium palustre]|jgi:hypothetical protein|uniref:Uncharacterized protein n=1 Tax=Flavobacterium palustre TaxID=1476463 RepID=A0ABQ1HJC7_9FLAO|nr:hypothetical protein GCM10008015_19260 [Flavobacterium palustre]